MKIDLQQEYNVSLADGTTYRAKLIGIIESWETYHLRKFGTFLHVATYGKHRDAIKDGIEKNGFHDHNGYRLTYIANRKGSNRWGYFDLFVGFATCVGIITDDGDRVVDPNVAMQLYYKQVNPKTRQWNDRGARRHAYGSRKRHIFGKFFAYTESKRKKDYDYTDYERQLDVEYFDVGVYDACLEMWTDVPEPQIRRNDLVDAFMHREAWWDDAKRSVEKSWKYQSKRRHQWKPKKEIIETF